MIKTWCFYCREHGLGTKIPHAMWMWFGAFPGAFGLGRAQPQRRGTTTMVWGSDIFCLHLCNLLTGLPARSEEQRVVALE